ncbi:MAG: alpha/beta hydrolase [Parasphingorhabdus sp.]|uniref:alpha/beta fold hydrolase n=1 Tax=Parasphingorhabdus sp. TaxID=2709688 RepID=UPI003297C6C9
MMAKRLLLGSFAAIAVAVVAVLSWSIWPSTVDRQSPDPAVSLLNAPLGERGSLQEGYFEYADNRLHYVEAGQGETIVFLHGFPSSWFSFLRQVDYFKSDYRVVAIDGLGAGKSDAPTDERDYKLEAMAEHLAALLDELGTQQAHIVGHDWGSAFAIGFAQRYPERVLSVTGLSAPAINASLHALETDPSARKSAGYVERFKQANPPLLVLLGTADTIYDGAYRPLVEAGKLTSEEGDLFRAATSDPKRTNAHINWYRANLPHPDDLAEVDFWPSRNARVTMPALYIWGNDDPIFNQTALDRLMGLSDKPKLLTLPDIGHWPHVREAEIVNSAIRTHIEAASVNAGAD